jgi:hypothetical protein
LSTIVFVVVFANLAIIKIIQRKSHEIMKSPGKFRHLFGTTGTAGRRHPRTCSAARPEARWLGQPSGWLTHEKSMIWLLVSYSFDDVQA